ncbi:MAG: nucleoside monophosphate kinase [Candidatus Zambryskibacteria bacterium]|nr:nucleoside monophosphate kinase [Candidatus Zambryskibacteria bacterium]
MNPYTFIFIGRSGCGKGTQVELLQKYLAEKYPSDEVFYLETGERFRNFIKENSYSSKLSHAVYEAGERQPSFLAIWMWSHLLVESFKGTEHLIIDGSPRAYGEALALDTALKFYGRKACVVHLNVSRKWSEDRLLNRGRGDDLDVTKVKKRLDWFDKDVAPAIEYFRTNDDYNFIEVNGEQGIEEVYVEMMEKLNIRINE